MSMMRTTKVMTLAGSVMSHLMAMQPTSIRVTTPLRVLSLATTLTLNRMTWRMLHILMLVAVFKISNFPEVFFQSLL